MAEQEGAVGIGKRNVHVVTCGFLAGTVDGDQGGAQTHESPAADGVRALATVVPADGAELMALTFTYTSPGTGTHTQQWSISDGTNALATRAALVATTAAGTVSSFTMGTATNGKNLATTTGARLTLTNTSVGTSTDGAHGVFRLVWGL